MTLALSLIGCSFSGTNSSSGGSTGSGDGDTTTSFQLVTTWSVDISAISPGQGNLVDAFAGEFVNDATDYPDLVLLTQSGAYLVQNKLSTSNNGWFAPSRIEGTETAYSAGLAFDFDLSSSSTLDLLLFRNSPASFQIFKNSGTGVFSLESTQSRVVNAVSMAVAPYKTRSASNNKLNILSADESNSHQAFLVSSDAIQSGSLRNVGVSVLGGLKSLSADLNGDNFQDLLLVPSDGAQDIMIFKNIDDDVANFTEVLNAFSRPNSSDIRDAVLADFNADGYADLLLATASGLELHLNTTSNGSMEFTYSTALNLGETAPTTAIQLLYANFTEDAFYDLLVLRSGSAAPILYAGTASLTFRNITSTAFDVSTLPLNAVKALSVDVDQDNVNDIILLNEAGDILVYFNTATDSSDVD